ncbi:hypothetical protein VHEMI08875 [[Torrubiella] hemipterigena]|uniref:Subtilisin-like serine protease n=1 Tax=[Torrubiella] hemipterigena TaxID=1531966 RepID=A0A0A1TPB8_9HYPO|nr:hypothetical protein VHEMI08875 [[Torrubiella] hemipterigena]
MNSKQHCFATRYLCTCAHNTSSLSVTKISRLAPMTAGNPVSIKTLSVPTAPLAPPFSVRPLAQNSQPRGPADLHALLPASYRGEDDNVIASSHGIMACIAQELDLKRLSNIQQYLWRAGVPRPPRPLHRQLLLGRQIVITEQMDMHLVWTKGKIFLKPVLRFLLEPTFWSAYLNCQTCCVPNRNPFHPSQISCKRRCALGFLYSYTALITHESDFRVAQEKGLLPLEMEWSAWRTLVYQLNVEHIHQRIDYRFIHGELRLSRLNEIYYFYKTPLRGYMPSWDRYSAFFQYHFTWLASTIAYIAIVLTAMQVGLATEVLAHNDAFQSASYGFTIFSILGPLVAVALIVIYFCAFVIFNWIKAATRMKKRFSKLDCNQR